jgi:hypothetical protein
VEPATTQRREGEHFGAMDETIGFSEHEQNWKIGI